MLARFGGIHMSQVSQDYLERMNDEYIELTNRIQKLKKFYILRYQRQLDDFTYCLLKKQLKQMKAYRRTVKLRIKYENSKRQEHGHISDQKDSD